MAGRCCRGPCLDSPTGWTCGSSSSSTWRFSCLSTCCPEGAARGHQGNSRPSRTLGTRAVGEESHGCGIGGWERGSGRAPTEETRSDSARPSPAVCRQRCRSGFTARLPQTVPWSSPTAA